MIALALLGGSACAQTIVQSDDDRYSVSVAGFQTTGNEKQPRLYITLRLHNRSKEPLRLAVDAAKIVATDDASTRHFGGLEGALANVIDMANTTRFVLPAGGTADALLWLYSPTPLAKGLGKTFHIEFPVSNVTLDAKGKGVVGPASLLHITGLTAKEFAPGTDGESIDLPRVVAGPFAARVTSATVAPAAEHPGEALVMTIAVTNLTSTPLPLALGVVTGFAIGEHGRTYSEGGLARGHYYHQGIPDTSIWDVPSRFVLAPGETRGFTMSICNPTGTFSLEERLGYYFRLVELVKGDDAKLHPGQEYSLSLFYVRPTGRSSTPLGGDRGN